MKIRRISIGQYLFYPTLLNPLMYAGMLIYLLYILVFEWWDRSREGKYWVYKINAAKFHEEFFREFIVGLAGVVCNTFWMNRERTRYYRYYLRDKWFPTSKDIETQEYFNDRNYKSYLKFGKGRKDD